MGLDNVRRALDLLINKDDLHECRLVEVDPPAPSDGQALLSVEHFGLTSNNITYAQFGRLMSYWDFFPAEEGWGRMPVWGFAEVAESRVAGLQEGDRVYGYLPPSTELLVAPVHVGERGFVDGSPHRAGLPAAYNGYTATAADPVYEAGQEDRQMLLRPLFFTSWLLDDFLGEADMFGAELVIVSSASSRTASALAHLLALRGGSEVVGLTSQRSRAFTEGLGAYEAVLSYEQLEDLPEGRAVYVDISGDAEVRAGVHRRYGELLAHSAVVGATHHDQMGEVPEDLPGPRPTFFFAPDRVAARSAEWGRDGLEGRIADSWHPYVSWTEGWLRVQHERGGPALALDLPGPARRAHRPLLRPRPDAAGLGRPGPRAAQALGSSGAETVRRCSATPVTLSSRSTCWELWVTASSWPRSAHSLRAARITRSPVESMNCRSWRSSTTMPSSFSSAPSIAFCSSGALAMSSSPSRTITTRSGSCRTSIRSCSITPIP